MNPTIEAVQVPVLPVTASRSRVGDFMTLMMAEHTVMLPSMLVAMLLRADEYTCHARKVIA